MGQTDNINGISDQKKNTCPHEMGPKKTRNLGLSSITNGVRVRSMNIYFICIPVLAQLGPFVWEAPSPVRANLRFTCLHSEIYSRTNVEEVQHNPSPNLKND